jgi:hypothetical protein
MRRRLTAATTVAAIAAGSINTAAEAAPKRRPAPVLVPFSATATVDEEVDVLRHGPLALYFGCRGEFAFLGIRTEADGTLITSHARHMFGPSSVDAVAILIGEVPSAGAGQYVGTANQADHVALGVTEFTGSGASAIAPNGRVLTVPADSVGWGVHTARHSDAAGTPWETRPDCFVTGFALLSRARVLP